MDASVSRLSGMLPFLGACLGACASSTAAQVAPAPRTSLAPPPGATPAFRPWAEPAEPAEAEPGFALKHQIGALDDRDVDAALARHEPRLIACYERAGMLRKYVHGPVRLRFYVSGKGAVTDVRVIDSGLGNFTVERCLVDEGRRIVFPAPGGVRPTDFEYSLRFTASGEIDLVEWGADLIATELGQQSSRLAACGRLGPKPVRAVLYIEPGGGVASAGLSSDGPLASAVADCLVAEMRAWKLPDDKDHVVRTSFNVAAPPPAIGSRPGAAARAGKRPSRRAAR